MSVPTRVAPAAVRVAARRHPVRRGLTLGALVLAATAAASPPLAGAPAQDCSGRADTLRLDSLPWPVDSAQAVRRAVLALQGPTSVEWPVRVTAYERGPARVRLTVATDVEPRVVLACGSGRVAVYANGVAVVEERTTRRAGALSR